MICIMPKPRETKENIGKFGLYQNFKICASESTIKKVKIQPTGENICKSLKRLVCIQNINNSETRQLKKNTTLKMEKDLNKLFS